MSFDPQDLAEHSRRLGNHDYDPTSGARITPRTPRIVQPAHELADFEYGPRARWAPLAWVGAAVFGLGSEVALVWAVWHFFG